MSEENEAKEQELVQKQDRDQKTAKGDYAPVEVKTTRYIPDNVIPVYSDAMTVLHTANEFILSFFQAHYPAFETPKDLQQITEIKSRCVSQLIISPAQMQKVINALQENMERFRKNSKEGE